MPHALIVEDDPNSLSGLAAILDADGFSVDTAMTLAEARAALTRFIPDVVLIDLNLPDGKGLDLLPSLPAQPPDGTIPVIVMTGNATIESAIAGLRHGIWDYLLKPVNISRLRSLLARIPRPYELTEEVQTLKMTLRRLGRYGPLVGRAPSMQRLYDDIEGLATAESAVLLAGESGTGKECVARAIHAAGRRRKAAFVPFSPLNAQIAEADRDTGMENVPGHDSFDVHAGSSPLRAAAALFAQEHTDTAAVPAPVAALASASAPAVLSDTRLVAACERAAGGMLYIDDLCQLRHDEQQWLYRALSQHHYRKRGSSLDAPVDFRVVASVHQDPAQAVAAGTLDDALHQLLAAQTLRIPALRERPGDVDLLAQHFVDLLNDAQRAAGHAASLGGEPEPVPKHLAGVALRGLEEYQWPGNVRELREAVELAYRQAGPTHTAIDSLAPISAGQRAHPGSVEIAVGMPLADVEDILIRATLDAVGGTRHRAASMLGISPKTLYNKLQRMKLVS